MHLCFQHFQYTLSTKRNTIQRFEKHTAMKERQLMKAEKKLEDDAIAFEEFLRENDQRSVDALKMFVSPYCPPPPALAKSLFTVFFLLFSFSEHSPIQNRLTNLFLFSAAQETINKLQMTAELKKASLEIQSVKRWGWVCPLPIICPCPHWNLLVPGKTSAGLILISWWFHKYEHILKISNLLINNCVYLGTGDSDLWLKSFSNLSLQDISWKEGNQC